MYLEAEVAREVLAHLKNDELQNIGRAMAEVEKLDADMIETVVNEFLQELSQAGLFSKAGRDYVFDVFPDLLDDQQRQRVVGALKREISTDFEEYIAARPPATIVAILQKEHPQTQAVALHIMGQENAGNVLGGMSEEQQADLYMRMARLNAIPSELADDVEAALRRALDWQETDALEVQKSGTEAWKFSGVDRTAQILGRLGRAANEPLLGKIAEADENLSELLRRRMFLFEDLMDISDRDIQTLLKSVDRGTLLLSLRGIDELILEKFLANLSKRAAEDMREELEFMGPTPRAQIIAAREEIVQVALGLNEEGMIRLGMGGADEEVLI